MNIFPDILRLLHQNNCCVAWFPCDSTTFLQWRVTIGRLSIIREMQGPVGSLYLKGDCRSYLARTFTLFPLPSSVSFIRWWHSFCHHRCHVNNKWIARISLFAPLSDFRRIIPYRQRCAAKLRTASSVYSGQIQRMSSMYNMHANAILLMSEKYACADMGTMQFIAFI